MRAPSSSLRCLVLTASLAAPGCTSDGGGGQCDDGGAPVAAKGSTIAVSGRAR